MTCWEEEGFKARRGLTVYVEKDGGEMETAMETEGERQKKEEGTRQIQRAGARQTASTAVKSGPRTEDPVPGARHASKSRRRLHGRIWTWGEGSKRGANFSSHLCLAVLASSTKVPKEVRNVKLAQRHLEPWKYTQREIEGLAGPLRQTAARHRRPRQVGT